MRLGNSYGPRRFGSVHSPPKNLKLAIPMVGNEDERRFQMTPVELLYLFAPLLEALLTAQEAVLRDDPDALNPRW